MKHNIPIILLLFLFGCQKETMRLPDIYVAGQSGFWINGVYTGLNMHVESMSVDGSTVLVGGSIYGTKTEKVIWRNGEITVVDTLPGGVTLVASKGNAVFGVWSTASGWVLSKNNITTPIEPTGWPTAIALSGEDVYLSGSSQGNEYPWGSDFYALDTYAQLWKNGKTIFRDSSNSYASAIFIKGDDIYLAGNLNHYPSHKSIACYWKNGKRVALTDASDDAWLNSIFVTDDGHVYTAGTKNNQATYWKDGIAATLANSENSSANSIAVLGSDVYVGGQHNNGLAAFWKNGVEEVAPYQAAGGAILSVIAVSN